MEFCDCGAMVHVLRVRSENREDGQYATITVDCPNCGEHSFDRKVVGATVELAREDVGRGVNERDGHPLGDSR